MPARLSARQEQCVRLTAFRTDKEIAAHLGISEATVKKHIHEACQRLGVNRRKAALSILEQNRPGYPNDPMDDGADSAPSAGFEGDHSHGNIRRTAAALELGRPGNGVRPSKPNGTGPSLARASVASAQIGGDDDLAGGPVDLASGRGPAGVATAVLGYRPPPRGSLVRLILIAVTALVIAALLIAVGGLVSDFHHIVDRFDPTTP